MNTIARIAVGCCLVFATGITQAETITMARVVPYADTADISSKIKVECKDLQSGLASYTKEFAAKQGVTVELSDEPSKASGKVLQLEIFDAISEGNPFIGHHKSTRVRGTLMENGQKVASFKAMRQSMGGAFAGYKGSCSVLGRTVQKLGEDIGAWLKNPKDGAELGDL